MIVEPYQMFDDRRTIDQPARARFPGLLDAILEGRANAA
jgi:hypothetical protein